MNRTYYEILQVAPTADASVIAAAYRAQMLRLRKHPDLGGDVEEAATLNAAYETLSDPAKRRTYDAAVETSPCAPKTTKASHAEERRRAPRVPADAGVAFCIDHDSHWHPARVIDYSALGMRLRTHAPVAEGQHVVVVPPNLASFALHGTIRWARVFHPSVFERVYEAGIEFPDQITDIGQRLTI
jgi:hypothetical protein